MARMEASRALGTQAARQEVARAPVRARRAHTLPTSLGRKTIGEVEVGWAGRAPGRMGCTIEGQVSGLPGKCSVLFSVCFIFKFILPLF